jgi:hypothetical protein
MSLTVLGLLEILVLDLTGIGLYSPLHARFKYCFRRVLHARYTYGPNPEDIVGLGLSCLRPRCRVCRAFHSAGFTLHTRSHLQLL